MLEYCNEGDLQQELKIKGKFSEEESVEYFCQILNAFKTLYKNNIMHRDFKLPNILKHNGVIKVADFGFAKMLGEQDYATTMLGSPLNMAPEILAGKEYTNKADIWSIGVCFHEMLFGKNPYTAKTILDLLNKIKATPFKINPKCGFSIEVQDVLQKMLVYEPEKRIGWEELFDHPINTMLEHKIQKGLKEIDNQQMENVSRFYINNNKAIDHPEEINQKQEINKYATQANRNQKFEGNLIKRQLKREEANQDNQIDKNGQFQSKENLEEEETLREKQI